MLPQADVLGHTLIVVPTEWIEHIPTKNTKPGEKSPAIRCHVVDFSVADPNNPTVYRDVLWFGVITNSLRRQVGQFLAARMGQGQATQGNNPPWQLIDITQEADWMAFLNNWLDNTDAGKSFQAEANRAVEQGKLGTVTTESAPAVPAAPAAPAAPPAAPPVTAPAAAPVSAPAPAPAPAPAAPVANAAPAAAAPAANLEALLAAMPEDQRAAALAVLQAQGQAAH
jgi:hypothetical protein